MNKLEKLAELEHLQWEHWTKGLLERLKKETTNRENMQEVRDAYAIVAESLEMRWKPQWIPYAQLTEENKEHDRKWARKALAILHDEQTRRAMLALFPEYAAILNKPIDGDTLTKLIEEGDK